MLRLQPYLMNFTQSLTGVVLYVLVVSLGVNISLMFTGFVHEKTIQMSRVQKRCRAIGRFGYHLVFVLPLVR